MRYKGVTQQNLRKGLMLVPKKAFKFTHIRCTKTTPAWLTPRPRTGSQMGNGRVAKATTTGSKKYIVCGFVCNR